MMENDKLNGTDNRGIEPYLEYLYARVTEEHSFQFSEWDMDVFKSGFYECLKIVRDGRLLTDGKRYMIKSEQ